MEMIVERRDWVLSSCLLLDSCGVRSCMEFAPALGLSRSIYPCTCLLPILVRVHSYDNLASVLSSSMLVPFWNLSITGFIGRNKNLITFLIKTKLEEWLAYWLLRSPQPKYVNGLKIATWSDSLNICEEEIDGHLRKCIVSACKHTVSGMLMPRVDMDRHILHHEYAGRLEGQIHYT
jgi:hypothetical protein